MLSAVGHSANKSVTEIRASAEQALLFSLGAGPNSHYVLFCLFKSCFIIAFSPGCTRRQAV